MIYEARGQDGDKNNHHKHSENHWLCFNCTSAFPCHPCERNSMNENGQSTKQLLMAIREQFAIWQRENNALTKHVEEIKTDIKELRDEQKEIAVHVAALESEMRSVVRRLEDGKEKFHDCEKRLGALESATQSGSRCREHTEEIREIADKVSLLNGKTVIIMLVIASLLSAGSALIVRLL